MSLEPPPRSTGWPTHWQDGTSTGSWPRCHGHCARPALAALFPPQVLLILTALQPAIFSVLANGGQIACSPPFSSKIRSQGEYTGAPMAFQDGREGEGQGKEDLSIEVGQAGCRSRYPERNLQESPQRL